MQVYTLLVSAQLQLVNSAVSSAATWEPSCQHRVQLSAQLHSVSRRNPLPRLNSILPPKLWAVLLVATNQSRVHAVTVHCITRPVQATTCVPSLSNTMILQGVYNHPMRNEQKRPVSSMQVSQPQPWTQKDIGRCNSNAVGWLCLYSLCTCLEFATAVVFAEHAPLYSQIHLSNISTIRVE